MGGRGSKSVSAKTKEKMTVKQMNDKRNKIALSRQTLEKENEAIFARSNSFGMWKNTEDQKKWYDNSKQITDYMSQEAELSISIGKESKAAAKKTFINGYGEATNKYITTQTYERARKRQVREIERWLGNR